MSWDSSKIREIWDRLAEGWDANRDLIWGFSKHISEALVQSLDPQPGETILEVGTGPGGTGFLCADRVAKLICTDLSPQMIERARAAAERLGITNAEFKVMDVMSLDLPGASVDGILGRLVYHLVPDPVAALHEASRVLKPGGRICYTVLGPDDELPFDGAVGATMFRMEVSLPSSISIDVPLDDPKMIEEVTRSAGFDAVEIEPIRFEMSFEDDDAAWAYLTGLYGRTTELIRSLPPERQDQFRQFFLEELEPFTTRHGYRVPGLAYNVSAK